MGRKMKRRYYQLSEGQHKRMVRLEDQSVVKKDDCSCTGPKFSSRHHIAAHNGPYLQFQGILLPLLVSVGSCSCMIQINSCACTHHKYTNKEISKAFRRVDSVL